MNKEILKEMFLSNQIVLNDPIIEFFSKNLKSNLSEHLTALILFGSRARGDASKIVDVEVETLDRFERLTSSLVWEEKDWELKKRFPIGLNILKEGVLL